METKLPETQASEAVRNLPPALLPEISYSMALSSRFTLDRITYKVRDCPGDVFKRFIEGCGKASLDRRSWKPCQQTNLLLILDKDCSDVARWYAIDLLLEHKVAVPLEVGKVR